MYIRRKGNGLMGVGDAAACGANQQWDANCTAYGVTGQCVPTGMVGKQPGCTYPAEKKWWEVLLTSATDVAKAKVAGAPVTNVTQPDTGMSTTTKIAIAGAGVVALALILRSRSS